MMQHGALLKKCLPLKSKMREAIMRSPLLMWMRPVQFCTMRCANTYSSWRLCPPAQEAGGKWCKWNVYYVGTQGRGNVRADGSLWMVIQLGGKTLSELNPHPPPQTHTLNTLGRSNKDQKRRKQWPSYLHPICLWLKHSCSPKQEDMIYHVIVPNQSGWWLLSTRSISTLYRNWNSRASSLDSVLSQP